MEWRDEGMIIGLRRHGESAVILEAMTAGHGRHLGLVRGGRSAERRPVLQPGNSVDLVWRARLDEQLGAFVVEPLRPRAGATLGSGMALHAVAHLGALLRLLPERDPHPALHAAAEALADHWSEPAVAPAMLARFELALLGELGFGLDLSTCASTGAREDLIYVSPKSGRAVSRAAGEPWKARLLALPAFLAGAGGAAAPADVDAGLALTAWFLERDVFGPRGQTMPDARRAFIAAAARAGRAA